MNKRILISLSVIAVVAAIAVGATYAYFSSTASVTNNTFATGVLQIRVNGQPSIAGFTYGNAAPGDCKTGQFDVNNYGAPWFAGPSTLTAKELVISANNTAGSVDLWNALKVKVENCAGPCETAYEGKLKNLNNKDLLMSWFSAGLAPGNSETIKYTVCLPNTNVSQNDLQGLSTAFDFVIDAYNPVR